MSDTRTHHQYLADTQRITEITAERRAMELVRALSNAVNGLPHWRLEATNLLLLVHAGVLPKPHEPPHTQDEAGQDAA